MSRLTWASNQTVRIVTKGQLRGVFSDIDAFKRLFPLAQVCERTDPSQWDDATVSDISIYIMTPKGVERGYWPARKMVCLVNPEFLFDESVEALRHFDVVLVRSEFGAENLRERVSKCSPESVLKIRSIPFTSPDRPLGHTKERILYMGGVGSVVKGKDLVLDVWMRRGVRKNGFRLITTYVANNLLKRILRTMKSDSSFRETGDAYETADTVVYKDFISDAQRDDLQSRALVHVVPSHAEGFGHVINESRLCASPCVVLDFPPMNVLVRPEHGFLVPCTTTKKYSSEEGGNTYYPHAFATVGDMQRVLETALSTPEDVLVSMGRRARSAYEEDTRNFLEKVPVILTEEPPSIKSSVGSSKRPCEPTDQEKEAKRPRSSSSSQDVQASKLTT